MRRPRPGQCAARTWLARVGAWGPGTPARVGATAKLREAGSLGNCKESKKGVPGQAGGTPRALPFVPLTQDLLALFDRRGTGDSPFKVTALASDLSSTGLARSWAWIPELGFWSLLAQNLPGCGHLEQVWPALWAWPPSKGNGAAGVGAGPVEAGGPWPPFLKKDYTTEKPGALSPCSHMSEVQVPLYRMYTLSSLLTSTLFHLEVSVSVCI